MDNEKLKKVLSGEITDVDLIEEIIYCIEMADSIVILSELKKAIDLT